MLPAHLSHLPHVCVGVSVCRAVSPRLAYTVQSRLPVLLCASGGLPLQQPAPSAPQPGILAPALVAPPAILEGGATP